MEKRIDSRIKYADMVVCVKIFTLLDTAHPLAYSADKLEIITKYYGLIPKDFKYRGYDTKTKEFIFSGYSEPKITSHRRFQFLLAWYDFWIGWYYDRKTRWLYVFPIPMYGFKIKLPRIVK